VILTHGHEDHIGAVPFRCARSGHPVIGSRLTLALAREQLQEHRINPYTMEVKEAAANDLGPRLRVLASTTPIPERARRRDSVPQPASCCTRRLQDGPAAPDGRLTDLGGFARLGADGVDLLMSDATNSEVPGFVTPEREIRPVLDRWFRKASAGHRRLLRLARAPGAAGRSTWRPPTTARSRSSADRWSATWGWPATSATCASPLGW